MKGVARHSRKTKSLVREFSQRLRAMRRVKGFSQVDAANELSVCPTSFANWECGRTLPRMEIYLHIEKFLQKAETTQGRKRVQPSRRIQETRKGRSAA